MAHDNDLAWLLIAIGAGGFLYGGLSHTVSAIFLVGGLLMAKKPLNLW